MKELDFIFEDQPRNGVETLKKTIELLPKQLGQFVAPIFFSITLGFSQPIIADNFHEQPILVEHNGDSFETICGIENLRVWNRLDELEKLQNGWDGEDSISIKKQIVEKLRNVLYQAKENDLKDWVLFPDAMGYLYLDYSKGSTSAGITLLENTCHYFIMKNGTIEKDDNLLFSPENIISIVRRLQ